jgi:hypothetical protein
MEKKLKSHKRLVKDGKLEDLSMDSDLPQESEAMKNIIEQSKKEQKEEHQKIDQKLWQKKKKVHC